ncbi:MAG: hypothetical protein U0V48_03020 [Anaerolineales bacterium]
MAKNRDERFASASEFARALNMLPRSLQGASKPILVSQRSGNDIATEVDAGDASAPGETGPASRVESDRAAGSPKSDLVHPSQQTSDPKSSSRGKLQIASAAGVIIFLCCMWGDHLARSMGRIFQGRKRNTNEHNNDFATRCCSPMIFPIPTADGPRSAIRQNTVMNPTGITFLCIKSTRRRGQKRTDKTTMQAFVDAAPVTNSSGFYGIICKIQENGNFYYFIVQNNGVFAIGKIKGAVLQPLVEWTANNAIRQGNQTNRLRADCDGSALRFYVNDVFVGEASDSVLSGYSGLIVNALDAQAFDVVFNNFQITEPSQ